MNFVAGDKGLGSSVVSVAKNNISRFNRVENAVPQQSLVSQLIPNISNPIERKGSKEDTNFISEYLDFFGSKKTAKTFKENLTFIKKSLTNTFEIAKILRVAIKNIVDQLKGLQGGDGGGGIFGNLLKTLFSGLSSLIGGLVGTIVTAILGKLGLKNLAKIFKKTAPDAAKGALKGNKLFSRMGKFGKFGLIAGGLGLGGLAISNLLGDENMNIFNNILGKFERAIDSLMGKKPPGGNRNPGGGNRNLGGGNRNLGGGNIDFSKLGGDTPEQKAWLATINAVEANNPNRYNTLVGGEIVPELTKMTIQEVYDMAYGREIGKGNLPARFGGREVNYGASSHAAGGHQFHPLTMLETAKRLGLNLSTTLFSPKIQDTLALGHLQNLGVDPNQVMTRASLSKAGSTAGWEGLSVSKGKITEAAALKLYQDMLEKAKKVIVPKPQKKASIQQKGEPLVAVLPMSAPKPAVEQSASPIINPQSDPGGGAPTVAFLIPSNPDTGHTQLSARSTFNIIT